MVKFLKVNFKSLIIAISILTFAFFLRVYNIFAIPIFVDEAIYIRWAQVMKSVSTLRFLPLSDGKQPLFMWITIPFLKIFDDPLVAGRAVSAICGIFSAVGIFLLTYILFKSRKAAYIASFLYVISPFTIFFDRMALVDSMLSMFGIWFIFFIALGVKKMRLDSSMLAGFALGGAWLTKSPAIFYVLLMPVTVLLVNFTKKTFLVQIVKLMFFWGVAFSIGFGFYNILRLGPEYHMISIRNKDYVFPITNALTNPFDPLRTHLIEVVEWLWALLPGSVLIIAIIGILIGIKKHLRETLFLLSWFLIPIIIVAEYAKVFTARYILFTLPPLFIFSSLFIVKILEKKKFAIYLLTAVFVPILIIDYLLLTKPESAPLPRVERAGYLEVWTSGVGIREVAQYVKSEKIRNQDTNIIIGTEGFFGTLPDGLQIYVSDIPGVVVKGVGITITSVDSSLINAKRSGDKVYLVVNSSRFEGDPHDMGLVQIASYPKAINPKGEQEKLLLFEVTERAIEIFDLKDAEN